MLDFTGVKAITIPEGNVKKITANGTVLWEAPSFKNWIPYSTTSDGVTIYNGTGYKDGYRIRSGGAEAQHGTASHSGFTAVKAGDVVRVSGFPFGKTDSGNAINGYDSSFACLGQLTPNYANGGYGIFANTYLAYSWKSVVEEKTGVWKWVVPPSASNVAYIRLTGLTGTAGVSGSTSGSKMILTINEEIA